MRCDEARPWLGAFVDGELGSDVRRDILVHIEGCRDCAHEVADLRRLSGQVARNRLDAPAGLRELVLSGLAEAERQTVPRHAPAGWPSWTRVGGPRPGAMAAMLAACLICAAFGWFVAQRAVLADRAADDALTAHLRGIVQEHLVQVASSESHTVKPWFAGRIEFSPGVKDLAVEGFPLVGGRIDFVAGERVAALVYGRRLHTVTVLMRPNPNGGPGGVRTVQRRGYNLMSWTGAGIDYWMVSDLNADELGQLQRLL